jgi:hypothetical protein
MLSEKCNQEKLNLNKKAPIQKRVRINGKGKIGESRKNLEIKKIERDYQSVDSDGKDC